MGLTRQPLGRIKGLWGPFKPMIGPTSEAWERSIRLTRLSCLSEKPGEGHREEVEVRTPRSESLLLAVDGSEEKRREEKRRMEAPKTIAHEIGGVQNDALRFGLHGVKSDIVGSHPLESAYQSVSPSFSFSLAGFCNLCFSVSVSHIEMTLKLASYWIFS